MRLTIPRPRGTAGCSGPRGVRHHAASAAAHGPGCDPALAARADCVPGPGPTRYIQRVVYVLGFLVIAFLVALAVSAVRGRAKVSTCCNVPPERDLRLRDAFADRER